MKVGWLASSRSAGGHAPALRPNQNAVVGAEAQLGRLHALGGQCAGQAQIVEHPDRVGQAVDAHAEFPRLGHCLEHRHVVASPVQAEGGH